MEMIPYTKSDVLAEYQFDPFQFGANPRETKHFNRLMIKEFAGSSRILDLGCGDGSFLEIARLSGIEGVGVDNHPAAVHACKAKQLNILETEILQHLSQYWEEVKQFDGVYCAHVVEHLGPTEVLKLLELLSRGMKAGSKLVLVTPNVEDLEVASSSFWLDVTHVRPYPRPLIERMLGNAGFSKVQSRALYGLGLGRTYLKRLLTEKIRFGKRILRPNLVVKAIR